RLWFSCERPSGVAAAGAPRLFEHLYQTGRHLAFGAGDLHHASATPIAAADQIHEWIRPDFRGKSLSVLLHHHRLWGHLGLSCSYFVRDNAEDDHARMALLAHRLRVHA